MSTTTSHDRPTWDDLRRGMPVARQWAYFDHAAVAPLTEAAMTALVDWARDSAESGDAHWPDWSRRLEETRHRAAALLGAELDEVALVRNTTEGIGLVAEGYPWHSGDNVVTLADEFPSNQYPWLNLASRGVETRRVPLVDGRVELDAIIAACDARTRIVTVSWVGYASGWRLDVDQLVERVHQRGALVFLDAIQGLGVFPLDVHRTGVDFLAADGHKWLLGPEGAGLFYVRHEQLDRLRPLGVGWNSVVQSQDFSQIELNLKPSAARYEGGTYNTGGLVALGESLDVLLRHSPERTGPRVLEIAGQACERLATAGAQIVRAREKSVASGIVAFDWPGENPLNVRRRCLERGVVLSCRGGRLRISPHAYNNDDDIERLVAALMGH